MKLLTHNMLTSNMIKGVKTGFPLILKYTKKEMVDVDFNPEFIVRMMPKLHWSVVCDAAEAIGELGDVSKTVVEDYENDEDFLKKAHHLLLEVCVIEGELICPETGRSFPIKNGIPNMLLKEEEV